jgi:hypothetical protein
MHTGWAGRRELPTTLRDAALAMTVMLAMARPKPAARRQRPLIGRPDLV